MSVLLSLCLAATPLSVRILEKEHPRTVTLEAKALRCDAAALPGPAALSISLDGVRVGEKACQQVRATGDVLVRVGEVARRYPGTVSASVEGTFLRLIDEVDVEDYLPSVVSAENDAALPAALQAQAIVSRTFALASTHRHADKGYGLCDLSHCQVYRGLEPDAKGPRDAVEATRGQVLLVGGVTLEPAFFHAACGGHTSRPADVFGERTTSPGAADLISGAPACKDAPDFTWSWEVEKAALARAEGLAADGAAFEVLTRDEGGRVLELRSFGKRVHGGDFASLVGRAFGWQSLRSLKVTAQEADGLVRFTGSGLGHGVGLCQHGARALAVKGLGAKEILLRYFPQSKARVPELP